MTQAAGDRPASPVRVLAIHLGRSTTSEAKVLSAILQNLPAGVEVTVLANADEVRTGGVPFVELAASERVRVVAVDVGVPVDPWAGATAVARLRSRLTHVPRRLIVYRTARKLRPDVIYTSQQRFDCRLGELLARALRRPHVVHLHFLPTDILRKQVLRRLVTCQAVIAISDYIARLAIELGVPSERVHVIHNTLATGDLVEREWAPSGSAQIGQIGRMDAGKGFPDSVRAFSGAHAQRPTTELVFVGDGGERRLVEEWIDRLHLRDAVHLEGWQSDVSGYLRRFDVFVHPSLQEPFGLAILEAMTFGLPVVAYAHGAVPELIEAGVSGVLVAPGDVDALAGALLELIDDVDERRRLGGNARRRAAEVFDPALAGRAFGALVQGVAGRPIEQPTR